MEPPPVTTSEDDTDIRDRKLRSKARLFCGLLCVILGLTEPYFIPWHKDPQSAAESQWYLAGAKLTKDYPLLIWNKAAFVFCAFASGEQDDILAEAYDNEDIDNPKLCQLLNSYIITAFSICVGRLIILTLWSCIVAYINLRMQFNVRDRYYILGCVVSGFFFTAVYCGLGIFWTMTFDLTPSGVHLNQSIGPLISYVITGGMIVVDILIALEMGHLTGFSSVEQYHWQDPAQIHYEAQAKREYEAALRQEKKEFIAQYPMGGLLAPSEKLPTTKRDKPGMASAPPATYGRQMGGSAYGYGRQ